MSVIKLETIPVARFVELVGTDFRVQLTATDAIDLKLAHVTGGAPVAKQGANAARYENFSLLFHGAQARPLAQGTYAFEHPQLGRFDLFIVPVAAEQGMIHYQAVFNRLVHPA